MKRIILPITLLLLIAVTQHIAAQNQNTVINGVNFNYPLSPYASSIDYSTNISAPNCGVMPSDWVDAIEFGVDNGSATITITLPNPVTSITFLLGAMDISNGETVSYVSNNGGGSVSLSTTNAGVLGCFNVSGNLITPTENGSNGRIIITATQPFTEVLLSITGPYTVISSVSSTVVVPVKLVSFAGWSKECNAILEWKTAEESRIRNFEILQSWDGVEFKSIAQMLPQGINTIYKFQTVSDANAYFKLKMNDVDGNYAYSNIIKITSSCKPQLKSLVPNPSHERVAIMGGQKSDIVQIMNSAGQVINTYRDLQNNILNIGQLSPGFYTVKIFSKLGEPVILKLVKE